MLTFFRIINAWSLVIAALSVVPGLIAANALVRILRDARWRRLAAILCIAPLCVPGYAVFWYWWQFTGPGSSIGAWALRIDAAVLLREGVLLVALVCWSWPLVTWPVVLSRLHRSGHRSSRWSFGFFGLFGC